MYIKQLLCLLFLLAAPVEAQQYTGLDLLALARFDAAMVARNIPKGTAIGALQGTFGDVVPNLDKLLATGKVSAFRVHLVNTVCRRNKNCENGEPAQTDFSTYTARARQFGALAAKYPQVACFISPSLEHDEKNVSIVSRWIDIIRREAPTCKVVVSAFTGVVPAGVIREKHGNAQTGQIVSNDGDNLFDSDSTKYRTAGSLITFGWIPRFNMRFSGEKVFTPPSKRTAKPSAEDIQQAVRLLMPEFPKPAKPAQCATVREVKAPELHKTNSEDYNGPDPRGNRPLLISKKRYNTLDVLAPSGAKIGCAKYYGGFPPNLFRHYVGSCSGDSGVSLMNKARNEWIFYKAGRECILVNSIRRTGSFR